MLAAVRRGSFFTRERVRGYAYVLLAYELAFFILAVAVTHGWIGTPAKPTSSDFVSFYAAGRLADAGTPALAYDRAAHYASERQATEPGIDYNFFYYPPTFLLLCAALARLPYLASFIAFQVATLLPCLAVTRRIVGVAPWPALLAFPAVFWAVGTGQNALLTATLLGAATLLVDRRPLLAGCLAGCLCYKPHLALLLPVAFVAGGHWRAVAAAAATALALVAASLLAFGWSTWHAFLAAAGAAGSVYASTDTTLDLAGLTSPFGLALALGVPPATAVALHLAVALAVATLLARVWRRPAPLPVRAALLLAAIPVATPVLMFYDLVLVGPAIAWLVRAGRDHGFPPWQRTLLAALFVLPLLSGNTGFATQIGIPPATAALALILALRQAAWDTAPAAIIASAGTRRSPRRLFQPSS